MYTEHHSLNDKEMQKIKDKQKQAQEKSLA